MIKLKLLGLAILSLTHMANYGNDKKGQNTTIVIDITGTSSKKTVFARVKNWEKAHRTDNWDTILLKTENGKIKWDTITTTPMLLEIPDLFRPPLRNILVSPGDRLAIEWAPDLKVTGAGSQKIQLQINIANIIRKYPLPKGTDLINDSLFIATNNQIDDVEKKIVEEIEKNRFSISETVLDYLKVRELMSLETSRMIYYNGYIIGSARKVSPDVIKERYNTYMLNPTRKWLNSLDKNISQDAMRQYYNFLKINMPAKRASVDTIENRNEAWKALKTMQMHEAISLYRGEVLHGTLFEILAKDGLDRVGGIPEHIEVLREYYALPQIPESEKDKMRAYEAIARKRGPGLPKRKGPDLDSTFLDAEGRLVTSANLTGKIVVINFYNAKIGEPAYQTTLENQFKNNPSVVIANVPINNQPNAVIPKVSPNINFWKLALNIPDSMLSYEYGIKKLPALFVYNHLQTLTSRYLYGYDESTVEAMMADIHSHILGINDGPYIWQFGDSTTAFVFTQKGMERKNTIAPTHFSFSVATDIPGKSFEVTLKKNLKDEPSVFAKPSKILALSDIEGNFGSLRNLLQKNGVIDENFNWTYGDGHLVISGDVFDRGKQVTECLWLIYSLEEKSQKAGGYVHYVLGNHEMMTIEGADRYAQKKYLGHAALMGIPYVEVFSNQSVLGKWLRSKNVIEKVGDIIFVHGGISPAMNAGHYSLEEINETFRKYMRNQPVQEALLEKLVKNSEESVHWYRGYYNLQTKNEAAAAIDASLKLYNANAIVTGHCIVPNITAHFDGKLFNTDTRHAHGISQALLITDNKYIRTNDTGTMVTIWPVN